MATINIPDQLVNSIKLIVEKTGNYKDEADFVQQAIMKQLMKYKDL
ncbi:hypothetical protein K8R47_00245 [archaeon]|nr:hypothetical protein [archaeon]